MPVIMELDKGRNLVIFRLRGGASLEDAIDAIKNGLSQSSPAAQYNVLWDLTAMTPGGFDSDVIQGLADATAREGGHVRPPGRTAILASSDLQYGLARMFESWVGDDIHWKYGLFRDLEKALAWLDEK